eukprot:5490713-Prymnesium_polylepis.1
MRRDGNAGDEGESDKEYTCTEFRSETGKCMLRETDGTLLVPTRGLWPMVRREAVSSATRAL